MTTPNVALPEIAQNQSSKEVTHNLALRIIDVLVPCALVQTRTLTAPPGMVSGNMYIVGASATGAWTGQDNKLAYTDGASWYFVTPKNKWPAYVIDELLQYRFTGSVWVVDTIGNVSETGTTIDKSWARYSGTTGKQLQPGLWVESDTGDVTAGGNLNMGGKSFKSYSETPFNLGNMTGAVTIDFANGNFQYGVLTGNVTFTISNAPASGKVGSMTLELAQDATGSRLVTFPASVKYAGGTAPVLSTTASSLDVLVFYTRDGGSTYKLGVFGLSFS
jgi:hypothetical protein